MTKFWVDNQGRIKIATSDDGVGPPGTTAVLVPPAPAPESGEQKWDGAAWSPLPPRPPVSLDAEELYDMLVAKGVVGPADRPRPKP